MQTDYPAMPTSGVPITTDRLRIRFAAADDAPLIVALWTDPRVMSYVGFPQGLPTSETAVRQRIDRGVEPRLDQLLVVELRQSGQAIGQCKLGTPDLTGISEPDIKLLPNVWGHRYGQEAWAAMIDCLFTHSDCDIVQGTPNVDNVASIRMMETAGMSRVGDGVFEPPESMQSYATSVTHYVYQITRSAWEPTS